MKIKDFIEQLKNFNQEAKLKFVISESFEDSCTWDNYV